MYIRHGAFLFSNNSLNLQFSNNLEIDIKIHHRTSI
ncbi:hypothetical protein SAMN04515667_0092 [Formosa sp. Hel1_31_208]|nr:hypothetical protein SAMN04515667_0092 [Formosa sp. Hel1_31_208]